MSSPNPTTAATTEISYGDESYITLKSQSQLLDEINAVVEYQDISFSTIEEFINWDLEKLKSHLVKINSLLFRQLKNIINCMSICWKMEKNMPLINRN